MTTRRARGLAALLLLCLPHAALAADEAVDSLATAAIPPAASLSTSAAADAQVGARAEGTATVRLEKPDAGQDL